MDAFNWIDTSDNAAAQLLCSDNRKLEDFLKKENLSVDVFSDSARLLTGTEIEEFADRIKFQGFNLDEIRLSFAERAVQIYPELKDSDKNKVASARTNMLKDVAQMMCFLATRSTNIERMDDLTTEKAKLRSLFSKWGIKNKLQPFEKSGGLTLTRVAFLHPSMYVRTLFVSGNLYRFGKVSQLEPCYHCTIAPAMIPRDPWGKLQLKLWAKWCHGFNNQINSGKSRSVLEETIKNTARIAKVQYETGYSNSERLMLLLEIHSNIASNPRYRRLLQDSCIGDVTFLSMVEDELKKNYPARADEIENMVIEISSAVRVVPAAPMAQKAPAPMLFGGAAVTVKKS